MDTSSKSRLLNEINLLIKYSCKAHVDHPKNFEGLHKAILKKYFQAEGVIIDRKENCIKLTLCVDNEMPTNCNIDVAIDFEHFDEFLLSCVEQDQGAMLFYKNMLHYYHAVEVA